MLTYFSMKVALMCVTHFYKRDEILPNGFNYSIRDDSNDL